MKLFAITLASVLGLGLGFATGCDDKVYEKKVEQKDSEGNTVQKHHKTVTEDDDGNRTTETVTKDVDKD